MATIPAIYQEIPSHFKNKYPGTSYARMSRGLSDALDCFAILVSLTPAELGLWQGCFNDNGPLNSKGQHGQANAADLVLPSSGSTTRKWVRAASYIGIAGWVRDSAWAHGSMLPRHFHCFALHMMNVKYVNAGIIGQQASYLNEGTGLARGGSDYHAVDRPDLRSVHFMGKAPSKNAVVTADTHSYKQPGKLKAHQDATRKKGYKITTALCVVRVWQGEKSTDMLVTEGLRFYDLAKVKWA